MARGEFNFGIGSSRESRGALTSKRSKNERKPDRRLRSVADVAGRTIFKQRISIPSNMREDLSRIRGSQCFTYLIRDFKFAGSEMFNTQRFAMNCDYEMLALYWSRPPISA
jgi:hypothetical protein